MSIRITLPGGVIIETDTLPEALAVARAVGSLDVGPATHAEPGQGPVKKRTRILTTNADLDILETWGVTSEEHRKSLTLEDWTVIAQELNRSVDAAQSLGQRFVWGVYTRSGSDPTAKATVHAEKDRSRPGFSGWVDPAEA